MYLRYINGVTKQLATGGKKAWFIMFHCIATTVGPRLISVFG